MPRRWVVTRFGVILRCIFAFTPISFFKKINIGIVSHAFLKKSYKCQYLPIKRKGSVNNNYFLGDCAILCTSSVTDLGILISSDLKWSPHIAQMVSNASFSHRILKTFSTKNIWTLMKAFVIYVRPKLEYNTVLLFGFHV